MATKLLSPRPRLSRSHRTWANVPPGPFTTTGQFIGANSTFTGVENPYWKDQIRRGVQAGTNASGTFFKVTRATMAQFKAEAKSTSGVNYRGEEFMGYPNFTAGNGPATSAPGLLQSADNDAIAKLYEVLTHLRGTVPQGENLGEIKQTYNGIVRPMGGILDATNYLAESNIRSLKGAKWNTVKQVVRALGSSVIEWRWAIDPLLRDIAEVYVNLRNRDEMVSLVPFRAKGKAMSSSYSGEHIMTPINGNGGFAAYGFHRMSARTQVRYIGGLKLSVDVPRSLPRALGLQWSQAIPTAWALVPYSVILDYVLNVDDLLTAFNSPWSDIAWCLRSVRNTNSWDWQGPTRLSAMNFVSYPNATVLLNKSGHLSTQTTSFTRSIVSSKPVPALELHWPKNRHLVNTAALLASKLPIIGAWAGALKPTKVGQRIDREFKLATRDRRLKIKYPRFTF